MSNDSEGPVRSTRVGPPKSECARTHGRYSVQLASPNSSVVASATVGWMLSSRGWSPTKKILRGVGNGLVIVPSLSTAHRTVVLPSECSRLDDRDMAAGSRPRIIFHARRKMVPTLSQNIGVWLKDSGVRERGGVGWQRAHRAGQRRRRRAVQRQSRARRRCPRPWLRRQGRGVRQRGSTARRWRSTTRRATRSA